MSLTANRSTQPDPLFPKVDLPKGFTTRPAAMDDVDTLARLFNTVSQEIMGFDDFSSEELTTDYGTQNFDMQEDTLLVLNQDGEIVAYQDVFATRPVPVYPIVWGRVHPDYTGRGLGTYLLRWGVQRARHVFDKVPPEARVAVRAYTENDWAPSISLLRTHGFRTLRHYLQMRIDMHTPPPAPRWPEGITLEKCPIPDGLEPFYRAFDEAFSDHFGYIQQPFKQGFDQWTYNRLNDERFDPSLWFQAMDGDEIAGICLGRKWGWESEEHGFVSILGVRRPWRKRGLGLALLHHIFNVYWERGQKSVSLGVDAGSLTGAVRLYEKAGMYVHHQSTNFELELRPGIELAKTDAAG